MKDLICYIASFCRCLPRHLGYIEWQRLVSSLWLEEEWVVGGGEPRRPFFRLWVLGDFAITLIGKNMQLGLIVGFKNDYFKTTSGVAFGRIWSFDFQRGWWEGSSADLKTKGDLVTLGWHALGMPKRAGGGNEAGLRISGTSLLLTHPSCPMCLWALHSAQKPESAWLIQQWPP